MLRFVKLNVSTSLLLSCTNRMSHPYKMDDRVFELKLVYQPPVKDAIVCTVRDPEFAGRICYLNFKLKIYAQASANCFLYTTVYVTCKNKGKKVHHFVRFKAFLRAIQLCQLIVYNHPIYQQGQRMLIK